jgi:hypothetical protein
MHTRKGAVHQGPKPTASVSRMPAVAIMATRPLYSSPSTSQGRSSGLAARRRGSKPRSPAAHNHRHALEFVACHHHPHILHPRTCIMQSVNAEVATFFCSTASTSDKLYGFTCCPTWLSTTLSTRNNIAGKKIYSKGGSTQTAQDRKVGGEPPDAHRLGVPMPQT